MMHAQLAVALQAHSKIKIKEQSDELEVARTAAAVPVEQILKGTSRGSGARAAAILFLAHEPQ